MDAEAQIAANHRRAANSAGQEATRARPALAIRFPVRAPESTTRQSHRCNRILVARTSYRPKTPKVLERIVSCKVVLNTKRTQFLPKESGIRLELPGRLGAEEFGGPRLGNAAASCSAERGPEQIVQCAGPSLKEGTIALGRNPSEP